MTAPEAPKPRVFINGTRVTDKQTAALQYIVTSFLEGMRDVAIAQEGLTEEQKTFVGNIQGVEDMLYQKPRPEWLTPKPKPKPKSNAFKQFLGGALVIISYFMFGLPGLVICGLTLGVAVWLERVKKHG